MANFGQPRITQAAEKVEQKEVKGTKIQKSADGADSADPELVTPNPKPETGALRRTLNQRAARMGSFRKKLEGRVTRVSICLSERSANYFAVRALGTIHQPRGNIWGLV